MRDIPDFLLHHHLLLRLVLTLEHWRRLHILTRVPIPIPHLGVRDIPEFLLLHHLLLRLMFTPEH